MDTSEVLKRIARRDRIERIIVKIVANLAFFGLVALIAYVVIFWGRIRWLP